MWMIHVLVYYGTRQKTSWVNLVIFLAKGKVYDFQHGQELGCLGTKGTFLLRSLTLILEYTYVFSSKEKSLMVMHYWDTYQGYSLQANTRPHYM